jgi:hypothetical protein
LLKRGSREALLENAQPSAVAGQVAQPGQRLGLQGAQRSLSAAEGAQQTADVHRQDPVLLLLGQPGILGRLPGVLGGFRGAVVRLLLVPPRRGGLLAGIEGEQEGGNSPPDQGEQHRRRQAGHHRVAPHPLDGPLQRAHPAGADRLARQEAPQVVGQFAGTGVAALRLLGQALQADRLQVARHARLERPRRHRLARLDLLQRLQQGGRLERRPAGQALVEDGAQGVDVGGRPHPLRLAGHLLRRHVARRAQDGAGLRMGRLGVQLAGQAEIGDPGRAVAGQQHVGRLEVTMHDVAAVRQVHGLRQHLDQPGRLPRR